MSKWVLTGSPGVLGSNVFQNLLELGFNPQDIILSVYNPKGVDLELEKLFSMYIMVIIIISKLLRKLSKVKKFYFLSHRLHLLMQNELQNVEMLLMQLNMSELNTFIIQVYQLQILDRQK
jgi:hypothetical protein